MMFTNLLLALGLMQPSIKKPIDITKITVEEKKECVIKLEKYYGEPLKNLINNYVEVFIYDPHNRMFLMVKTPMANLSTPLWHIPGTEQLFGQTAFETAKDYILDTYGLIIEPGEIIKSYGMFKTVKGKTDQHVIIQVVLAIYIDGIIEQTSGYLWQDIDLLLDLNHNPEVFKNFQHIYTAAVKAINEVEVNENKQTH